MTSLVLCGLIALIFIIICQRSATSAVKVGINCKVYRNTGTYGSPTWTAAGLVRDATPAFPWDMVDASSRATRAKLYAKTQIDLSFQLVVRADDADTAYGAFVDAAVSPTTVLDMMLLDGPITVEGVRGVRAHWNLSLSGQPQGAGDVVYSTFDLKPGYSSDGVPSSVVMGATSTPSFTAW